MDSSSQSTQNNVAKRKREDEDEEERPTPIAWKDLNPELINRGEYNKTARGAFGHRTYGAERRPLVVMLPLMEVAFEPSVWDEEKQLKYGKGDKNKLDPNRKTDKCSLQLYAPSLEFAEAYPRVIEETFCADMFEQRAAIWSNTASFKSVDSVTGKLTSNCSLDQRTGKTLLKLDMSVAVGTDQLPVTLYDAETRAELPAKTRLGKGSLVYAMVNLSDAFAGPAVKCYAKPLALYVKKLVRPQNLDPRAYDVPRFDD